MELGVALIPAIICREVIILMHLKPKHRGLIVQLLVQIWGAGATAWLVLATILADCPDAAAGARGVLELVVELLHLPIIQKQLAAINLHTLEIAACGSQ